MLSLNRMWILGHHFYVVVKLLQEFSMKNKTNFPDQLSILRTSISPGDGEQKYKKKQVYFSRRHIPAPPLARLTTSNVSVVLAEDKKDENNHELPYKFKAYSACSLSPKTTFLNGKYTIKKSGGVVVLDSKSGSEVDYIPDLEITRISISKRKQWIAFSHHGSNEVSIYEYNIDGKLKPLFFWEAQKEHVTAIAFLENGFLATGGGGKVYCTDNLINIWNIEKTQYDALSFSKAKVPLKYRLEGKGTKYRIAKLLAFPNNQLCSLHGTSFWNVFQGFWSKTVILWDLKTRKQKTISESATDIHYQDGNLVLDTLTERKEIDIIKLNPDHSLMISTQEQVIKFFMHGIGSTLESYYFSAHAIASGLLKRDGLITPEEIEKDRGKFKQYLKTIKTVMTVLSTATMMVSVVPGIAASLGSVAIIRLIEKIKKILDKINTAKDRIHAEQALAFLYDNIDKVIRIQHWAQGQYSLSPDELSENFKDAFDGYSQLAQFIHYSTQHFAWRYQNQIALLDEVDAQRLGKVLGERIAEPFMLGLSIWKDHLSQKEIIRRVSDWLYYAAHLPFLMKRAEPMPKFSTSEGDEASLPEILAPTGFEVADEKGAMVQIEVEPVSRVLTHSLQRHVGEKKEITVTDTGFKSYCSATRREIAQLQYQAKKIEKKKKENLFWSLNGEVKLIAKLGLFSTGSLPFIIKEEEINKMTSDMKETAHTIEDDPLTKLKKAEARLKKMEVALLNK